MAGLILLKEAAKISGYHQDYLSFLIRKGQLKGQKIGHNWFLEEAELRSFLSQKKSTSNSLTAQLKGDFFVHWKKSLFVLWLVGGIVYGFFLFKDNKNLTNNVNDLPVIKNETRTYYDADGGLVSDQPAITVIDGAVKNKLK